MKRKPGFEFRITLTYLLFGVCWIIFTDILLETYVKDSLHWSNLQSVKGIIYVIISSFIIFVLSRSYTRQQRFIKQHLRKSREKAEESDRLKSVFLANMSHEIRTPMNGILGFVRLLEETDVSEENYKNYIGYVKKSSERLLDTINDIIEISKIESKEATLNLTEVDLNETINFLYGFFQPAARKKDLQFKLYNSFSEEKVLIYTDKNKLESVLSNFIKNGIKFTHEGFIEFGCQRKNNSFLFWVKDTGIGIPKDRQEAIFERFIQSDLTVTKPYEGSGLGLSIAKAYAELLGGKVWLESEEGTGSTFWFSLNAEPVEKSN
ncbi:sensor histidine kinase [Mariniphaga sp.]|uniref:sensor histidine kinase n=1 Tax=Mariniphaga sp. TaxID=1954475 RepID=UPI00356687A8